MRFIQLYKMTRKKSKKSEASVASLAALALKQKTRCGDSKKIYKQIYDNSTDNAYYLHVTRQKNVGLKIKKAIDVFAKISGNEECQFLVVKKLIPTGKTLYPQISMQIN
jgi:hypothetical protein